MAEETKKAAPLVRLVQRLGMTSARSQSMEVQTSTSLDASNGKKGIRLGPLVFTVDVQGRIESDEEVATYSARAECRRDGPDGTPHVVVNENRRQWRKKDT